MITGLLFSALPFFMCFSRHDQRFGFFCSVYPVTVSLLTFSASFAANRPFYGNRVICEVLRKAIRLFHMLFVAISHMLRCAFSQIRIKFRCTNFSSHRCLLFLDSWDLVVFPCRGLWNQTCSSSLAGWNASVMHYCIPLLLNIWCCSGKFWVKTWVFFSEFCSKLRLLGVV